MSHYGKCKHGIYLDGCRECFPLLKLTKVGEEIIQELAECFNNNKDREMTANELADLLFERSKFNGKQVPSNLDELCCAMLRQQEQEIADLKIANQDLKYQLIQKSDEQVLNDFKELTDEEAIQIWDSIPLTPNEGMIGKLKLFKNEILKKAREQ